MRSLEAVHFDYYNFFVTCLILIFDILNMCYETVEKLCRKNNELIASRTCKRICTKIIVVIRISRTFVVWTVHLYVIRFKIDDVMVTVFVSRNAILISFWHDFSLKLCDVNRVCFAKWNLDLCVRCHLDPALCFIIIQYHMFLVSTSIHDSFVVADEHFV